MILNLKELKQLVKQGESDRLEFKKTTGQRTAATKTVCAMLNGMGGFVLFGVTDKGEIHGQQVSAKTIEDISNEIRNIEPPAFPDIETISLKSGKTVIIIHITGSRGLYAYSGRSYIRNGPTTIQMPRSEYNNRLMEKLHETRRWENEPVAEGVTVSDLDDEEIQTLVANSIRIGRMEPPKNTDTISILRGLDLIRDDKLLNAAVVLFGRGMWSYYPQCEIRLARFREKDRSADFIDNRQYKGNAFSLLRRAERFLLDHVPIAGRVIPGKMVREDNPWYPPPATREAIANAICHRDYTEPGGAVALAMHDDRLEIINPGEFHFGITPEKLKEPHESKPWNPLIANAFYRAGIIERWGSGTTNIIDWCEENGNPVPHWQERTGSVVVTFIPIEESKTPQVTMEVAMEVAMEVTMEVARLLPFCEQPVSRRVLQEKLKLRNTDHFRKAYILPSIEEGWIEMTIPDKPQSRLQMYRLTKKGKAWLDNNRDKKK
ncbi:MAG: putative DNA binding domain-containing protein [Deltaproteobacteria bacterium]|nr:putative DNA binding domain-containing protein [Deltaproteobacteria bacterium]